MKAVQVPAGPASMKLQGLCYKAQNQGQGGMGFRPVASEDDGPDPATLRTPEADLR